MCLCWSLSTPFAACQCLLFLCLPVPSLSLPKISAFPSCSSSCFIPFTLLQCDLFHHLAHLHSAASVCPYPPLLCLGHLPHPRLLHILCLHCLCVLSFPQARHLYILYWCFSLLYTLTMAENESSYNFQCPLDDCTRWFKSLTGLTKHVRAKHPNEDVDINMGTFNLPD